MTPAISFILQHDRPSETREAPGCKASKQDRCVLPYYGSGGVTTNRLYNILKHSFGPGGKGTVRRKVVRRTRPSTAHDGKIWMTLEKLNVRPLPDVEEVDMFREDDCVLHFAKPRGEFLV